MAGNSKHLCFRHWKVGRHYAKKIKNFSEVENALYRTDRWQKCTNCDLENDIISKISLEREQERVRFMVLDFST